MLEEQRVIDQIKVELELAKALLTSTSAKLELGTGSNIYAFYPIFQLTVPPNLPDEDLPTTPKKKIALVGGLAGSFLIISGLMLLWWERKNYEKVSKAYEESIIFEDME